MKLKYDRISLENLLKLTDRYLHYDSIYTNLCTDNLPEFSNTVLEFIKRIPIIIFIKNDIYLNKDSLSNNETFKNIFIPISLEIEYILNIYHLVILINFYKRKKEFQDLSIPVLFVNLDSLNMNYNLLSELDILTTLKLFSNKNHNTINLKSLENMFTNNTSLLLKNKIQKTAVKYLFPVNRKKSIEKIDPIINPWNYLYLQSNSKYLSLEATKKNAKQITKIHCPICADEKVIDEDIVTIKNAELIFSCMHKETQFARYEQYKISLDIFEEKLHNIDGYTLCRFFKHNIQPVNRNNVYFIKHLLPNNQVNYIPLKQFMKVPRIDRETYKDEPILKMYYCPICAKKHYIYFDEETEDNYFDLENQEYVHYSKLFKKEKFQMVFLCDHKDTLYEQYEYFSIRYVSKYSFIDNSLRVFNYMGNYMDGKKIIYNVSGGKPYIIDLANYL